MKDFEVCVRFKVRGELDVARLRYEIKGSLMDGNNDVICEANDGMERPFLYPEFEVITDTIKVCE